MNEYFLLVVMTPRLMYKESENTMKKKGVLKRIGGRKEGRWEIVKAG